MCMDNHCGTENKYRNIKDHNNKFPTSNDMSLFFRPFFLQPLSILATLYIFYALILAKWKIAQVWGKYCFFLHLAIFKKTEQAVIALKGSHVIHCQKLEAI